MRKLTIALAKGRLAKETLKLFGKVGIEFDEQELKSRKLVVSDKKNRVSIFLAKASDVPTYVHHGAADIGVVGKDTLLEEKADLYEVLDLGIGACKMAVAGPPKEKESLYNGSYIQVATKYPVIAKDFFQKVKKQNIEIIKLNGSVELAPMVGLSRVIVDIVETGSTLRENGLVVLDDICPLSARMVVNKGSMKMKKEEINSIVNQVKVLLEG